MIGLLFAIVASGGGWIIGMIVFLLIYATGSGQKEKMNGGTKFKINPLDTYQLVDISKGMQVVASSNDYQEAFKIKRVLGNNIIIKNNGPFISNLRKM